MFLIRNYVPNWTTTPPAPTIAPTTASNASTQNDWETVLHVNQLRRH